MEINLRKKNIVRENAKEEESIPVCDIEESGVTTGSNGKLGYW